ncbi:MAG: 3-deoxy-D-manno-octulosonate cytidylyltransferase [Bacteroidetes bacterium RBG_19FT_COMBO_42_10]|nr:MAG: 3-deoxy-D-manno-octulosonate cytidylyltransferase [Bacteroidetes bacterium RBG_19FT_COMBO_42_10]
MERYLFAGIIPARYASKRFPGKPLAMIGNKSMIRRVYEQVGISVDILFVATDDKRIFDEVKKFGGNVLMTSPEHLSGTDRCAEAVDRIMEQTGKKIDVVINIQGDEPFIKPEQIDLLKSCFTGRDVEIATLVREVAAGEDIFNPNQPKVVLDTAGNAIYFSRTAIPFIRDYEMPEWSKRQLFYKHIGLYAYTTDTLKRITKLPVSSLEMAEALEQNRWLENGYKIRTAVTNWESIGVDTPEDLLRALEYLDHFS